MATGPAPVYLQLREKLFATKPADLRLAPRPSLEHVWGALMELGVKGGSATVVSIADGTTSLYFSNGGGVLGGHAHSDVRKATARLLIRMERALAALLPGDPAPLPAEGEVHFVALTYAGVYIATASEADLRTGTGTHALAGVYAAGHDVITQVRLTAAKPGAAPPA